MTRQWMAAMLAASTAVGVVAASAGTQAPPAASASKAAAVAAAMKAKKVEVIAGREGTPGRFVAAVLVPDILLMVVSAAYERPTDIEYYLYTKDYMSAYRNLRTNALAKDQFIVEDAECNGLVALPGKSPTHDRYRVGTTEHAFDGLIADPRRRNSKGVPQDVYMKAFADADVRYAGVLDVLAGLVGKTQALAATPDLR